MGSASSIPQKSSLGSSTLVQKWAKVLITDSLEGVEELLQDSTSNNHTNVFDSCN